MRAPLRAQLVHADGGTHHATAGVRHAEILESALKSPVLATRSVKRNPDPIELSHLRQRRLTRVKRVRIYPAPLQGGQDSIAAEQRNLAFGRITAQEHTEAAKLLGVGRSMQDAVSYTHLRAHEPR